jgi:adenosylcobinamide-GDP ribazoletransferase
LVGLGIGTLLVLGNTILARLAPDLVRSITILCCWVGITGGLHLDGVADTADGLAVDAHDQEGGEKRLAVMSDSRIGAFGVIAVVMVMLLKVAALTNLPATSWPILLLTPAWGRWGQLIAIVLYPYLKAQGQGRFLKDSTRYPEDVWPMTMGILLVTVAIAIGSGHQSAVGVATQTLLSLGVWTVGSGISALLVGYILYRKLGGHTGDTYGAVVEWTEAVALIWATMIPAITTLGER